MILQTQARERGSESLWTVGVGNVGSVGLGVWFGFGVEPLTVPVLLGCLTLGVWDGT